MTSGDNSNILTARIARETYEIPNVVARIYDPRRAEIYQRLGIPTVATVSWTIDQVRRRLLPEEDAGTGRTHRATLLGGALAPRRWAGKRLADLDDPGKVTLVAVTRAGVPRLDFARPGRPGRGRPPRGRAVRVRRSELDALLETGDPTVTGDPDGTG